MPDSETLSHTKWDCKYHVVFIPKYRRKALYHELRWHLGEVFRALAEQKECRIEEGHLMGNHVHMLLSIPPKYSVAQVVGFIKGKATTWRVIVYEGERGIENKKTGLFRAPLVSFFTAIAGVCQLRGSPETALTPAGQSCLDSP
jgi:REP element-mobilizing transposase RayT